MMHRSGGWLCGRIHVPGPEGIDTRALNELSDCTLNIPMPDAKRKQKPQVSIIGTGRLGTALGVALLHSGYSISSLVARHAQKARQAAGLLDGKPQVLAAKQLSSLHSADVFLITVPDDQIASVAAELSGLKFDATALHTSGALSADVLAPLQKSGWHTGSVHPLISVSDTNSELAGAFWSVEGDRTALRLGKQIVRDLDGQSFSIRSEDKPLYHAAAVMASGNVVALFDVALEMLMHCGLSRKQARDVLTPLIASTVRSLEAKDPAHALTGTFSRGDVETVKRHVAALKKSGLQDALDLYRLLGQRSLKVTGKHPQITEILKSV